MKANGVYKSIDAGKTWTHVGLDETEHIGCLWIDPRNPDIVLAAALGKTFAPHPDRGVFKTIDGGKSWRKVLYKDDTLGAIDLSFAPDNPKIGFAAMWVHYVKPGNPRALIEANGGGGIYKTIDGGENLVPRHNRLAHRSNRPHWRGCRSGRSASLRHRRRGPRGQWSLPH